MMQIGFKESIYWKSLQAKKGVTKVAVVHDFRTLVYGKYFAAIKLYTQTITCMYMRRWNATYTSKKSYAVISWERKVFLKRIHFFSILCLFVNVQWDVHETRHECDWTRVNIEHIKCEANAISTQVSHLIFVVIFVSWILMR